MTLVRSMPTRKPWTAAHWRAFGARCRDARDRLARMVANFPPTRGLKAPMLGCLVVAHADLTAAMIAAEALLARSCPELAADAREVVRGPGEAPCPSPASRPVKSGRALDREEWEGIGSWVRTLRRDLLDLWLEVKGCPGSTRAEIRPFQRAANLGYARLWMAILAERQHPDWPLAELTFYAGDGGEDEP